MCEGVSAQSAQRVRVNLLYRLHKRTHISHTRTHTHTQEIKLAKKRVEEKMAARKVGEGHWGKRCFDTIRTTLYKKYCSRQQHKVTTSGCCFSMSRSGMFTYAWFF